MTRGIINIGREENLKPLIELTNPKKKSLIITDEEAKHSGFQKAVRHTKEQ